MLATREINWNRNDAQKSKLIDVVETSEIDFDGQPVVRYHRLMKKYTKGRLVSRDMEEYQGAYRIRELAE